MPQNDVSHYDKKWLDIIALMPKGGAYAFDKRQAGYDIIKGIIPYGSTIFDYACGLGIIDIQLEREKNCTCHGCDFSPVAIEYVKDKCKCADNWRVSENFWGYDYDAVIGVYILEHLEKPVEWIKTALILAPSVIVAIPNNFNKRGEHINMAWKSWDGFRELFKDFKFRRVDKYDKKVPIPYRHPILEFTRC